MTSAAEIGARTNAGSRGEAEQELDDAIARSTNAATAHLRAASVEFVRSDCIAFGTGWNSHGPPNDYTGCLVAPLPRGATPKGKLVARAAANRVWTVQDLTCLTQYAERLAIEIALISERHRRIEAESKLEEQLRLNRALIEATAEIVWVSDAHGATVEPSPTWQAFTGQSVDQCIGFGWVQVVHPDDRVDLDELLQNRTIEGKPHTTEYRLWHHSGHWRWIQQRAIPLHTPDGRLGCWIGVCQDIHARRLSEIAVMRAATEHRALVEAVAAITWSTGPDGLLRDGTAKKWCEFTGQSLEDWQNRRWLGVVHPEDRSRVQMHWTKKSDSPDEYEYRLWKHTGDWHWVLERTVPLIHDGKTDGWVGMTSDINDRKLAELALNEQIARGQALIEASSQIFWTASADGSFEEDSPTWRAYTGLSKEDFLNGLWYRDVHPEDSDRALAEWDDMLHDQKAVNFEYRVRHHTGEWRWVHERTAPLKRGEEIYGWVGMVSDVNDRKMGELALLGQEQRFRALVEASSNLVWAIDVKGMPTEDSPTLREFTGMSTEDFLNGLWWQNVHPDDAVETFAQWEKMLEAGVSYEFEYRMRHKSGQWRWIFERAAPLLSTGKVCGWVGMSRDIHDRKEAELSLIAHEQRFRALVEASAQIVWTAAVDGSFVEDSPSWRDFTGCSEEDWLSGQWWRFVHPDDVGSAVELWELTVNDTQSRENEYRLKHRSGEWRWVRERTTALVIEGKTCGWVGMTVDIHDTKIAELALIEHEQQFRALVEASSQIVWTADANGRIVEDSPSWRAFTGGSREDWLSGDWSDIHPDDHASAVADWQQTQRNGVTAAFEYRMRDRKGEWRYVRERVVPLRATDSSICGWVAMSTDITDQKLMQLALADRESRYRALVEATAQIIYIAEADGSVTEDSATWRAFTGGSREDWLRGDWSTYHHPSERAASEDRWKRIVEGGVAARSEYRLRHVSGEWRYMSEYIVPLFREDGQCRGWFGMASDVTEHKLAQMALEQNARLLRQALKAARMLPWTWDSSTETLQLTGSSRTREALQLGNFLDLSSRVSVSDLANFKNAIEDSAETGTALQASLLLRSESGSPLWLNAFGRAEVVYTGADGERRLEARGILQDITARKTADERRNLLVGEIAHRGKNLLAIVQSMAGITISDSRPPEESRRLFLDRLTSLARSHTMLTQQDWEGVPINEIIDMELASHSDRASIEVARVLLNPSSAQSVALVVHELVTNAMKYGALSNEFGGIEVTGELIESSEGRALRLSWREHGGPEVVPPKRVGFGSMLLRRLVDGFDTGGVIDYRPDGLFVRVDMPLDMIGPNHASLTSAATSLH